MLLGLVASMGFELPSGADLSRWIDSSRCWVGSTVADRSGHCGEASKPDVVPADCRQAQESCPAPCLAMPPKLSEDQAFEAVTDAIAADFTADLVAKAPEPQPVVEETTVVEVFEIPAVGLPAGEELVSQVVTEEKVDVAVPAEKPVTTELTEAVQDRLERISSAVRLTRDAVQAWADVIQDPIDEISPTR
jgi:hypothetical protein